MVASCCGGPNSCAGPNSTDRELLEKLTQAVGQVLQQTHTQRKASQDVERVIKEFSTASKSNMESLQDAANQVGALARRAEEVAREMARFRTREG